MGNLDLAQPIIDAEIWAGKRPNGISYYKWDFNNYLYSIPIPGDGFSDFEGKRLVNCETFAIISNWIFISGIYFVFFVAHPNRNGSDSCRILLVAN